MREGDRLPTLLWMKQKFEQHRISGFPIRQLCVVLIIHMVQVSVSWLSHGRWHKHSTPWKFVYRRHLLIRLTTPAFPQPWIRKRVYFFPEFWATFSFPCETCVQWFILACAFAIALIARVPDDQVPGFREKRATLESIILWCSDLLSCLCFHTRICA
jgi:hypothetical protein